MAGFDANKAAEYNKLIAQGFEPEAAMLQVGISQEESGNYEINSVGTPDTNRSYGTMTDIAVPTSAASATPPIAVSYPGGTYLFNSQAELDAYSSDPDNYASSFTGGGYTVSRISPPPRAESVFDPRQDAAESVFNPGATYNGPAASESVFDPRQAPAESVFNPAPTYNGPAATESVFDPRQEPAESVFNPGVTYNGPAATESVFDPRQAPAELVFNPGATYNGPAATESVFDTRQDIGESVFDPAAAVPNPAVTTAAQLNDPYAGLTPAQLQDLGGADPTDPYIRARLGIPQLPGSILSATSGFGTVKTGVPAIDSALGIISGGVGNLFSNFSATIGGLFGARPTASAVAATTGSGVAGLTTPVASPPVSESVFDPRQAPAESVFDPGATYNGPAATESVFDPQQDPTELVFDPGQTFNATGENVFDPAAVDTGETMSVAGLTARGINTTTLSADQADAFYNGTGTLTAEQRLAQDQQTAADAARLYPGSNNEALRQIDVGAGRIAANDVGIANAENIIAENNRELADPNITDQRRAELEANNEAQQDYIQAATENSAIQQNVIEQNANVYAAGGGNPGDGQSPDQVAALSDPGIQENVFDPGVGQPQSESVFDPAQDPGEQVFDPGQTFNADGESVFDPTAVDPNSDPFEQARFDAQVASEQPAEFAPEDVPVLSDQEADALAEQQAANQRILAEEATDIEPGEDPFEQARIEAEQRQLDQEPTFAPEDVPVLSDQEADALDAEQAENRRILAEEATDVEPSEDPFEQSRLEAEQRFDEEPASYEAEAGDPGPGYISDSEAAAVGRANDADTADEFQARQEAATRERARQQATFQARYKQTGNNDWRVRLSLGPNAQYLYNEKPPGILAPLANTDGVIFPYTPSITTNYSAQYEQYDLVHSNYRGLFYKNSRVGDIQIRGTFTAQDTAEADYLLAVIHFFRSATKMFYGQDAQRGVPPPVCLLNGLGQYQFSDHPVVISSFNYTTPNDVDYIRAGSPNNYGLNLLNRRAAVASNPGGTSLAGLNRLANALLKKGAPGQGVPDPNAVQQNVSNTAGATYVPTKMEIDITLIPVQTRSQISKQFSLKGFANGQLLKGGFW